MACLCTGLSLAIKVLVVLSFFPPPLSASARHKDISKQDASTVYWTVSDNVVSGASPSSGEHGHGYDEPGEAGKPKYPPIVDVRQLARIHIFANATCGEHREEYWCKDAGATGCGGRGGGGGGRAGAGGRQCFPCYPSGLHSDKSHPADLVLDSSTDRSWQSPTLKQGMQYEYVTITLDLQQVFLVSSIILKSGPSPLPAAWILERSLDGQNWSPWQYYAPTDEDCWGRYGIRATPGNPAKAVLNNDNEVICTSFHSRPCPAEGGTVRTWLVQGRPGASSSSKSLRAFQEARWVRLRLQKLFTTNTNADKQRAFYSIKTLFIGAQCICNGHASKCNYDPSRDTSKRATCKCNQDHHTDGDNCDRCRPRFNQLPWREGVPCVECNCHSHARACRYDENVARAGRSIDKHGNYIGGGVCINCTNHTAGINCERCEEGWYRPHGVPPTSPEPCLPCDCDPAGSDGVCFQDGEEPGVAAGTCICRDGFSGPRCDRCDKGFRHFPECGPCPCDVRGAEPAADCNADCLCKPNVEGARCDRCRSGYFGLDQHDPNGCSACFCFGLTEECVDSELAISQFSSYSGWLVSDLRVTQTVTPVVDADTGLLTIASDDMDVDSYYWLAPPEYGGNLLWSYGTHFTFTVSWVVRRGDSSEAATIGPDLIFIGSNGMRLAFGDSTRVGVTRVGDVISATLSVPIREGGWYLLKDVPDIFSDISTRLRRTGAELAPYRSELATREQIMSVLASVKHLLIRAKYNTEQVEGRLAKATLEKGVAVDSPTDVNLRLVEQCMCPPGYTGSSCESCAWGYARAPGNGSDHRRPCVKCDCNGHAEHCDLVIGQCGKCEHNTTGIRCENCRDGFFGDAKRGMSGDCRPCACPLLVESNNFSPTCFHQLPDDADNDVVEDYICNDCPEGYAGSHCERCADGYFGEPMIPGKSCQSCECGGGPCDATTGRCLRCPGNTDGWRCEKCKDRHYGDPNKADCKPCSCSPVGAKSDNCNSQSGACDCRPGFAGRSCDQCAVGLGNVTAGCVPCACDRRGSSSSECDSLSGECICRPGFAPPYCGKCIDNHYQKNGQDQEPVCLGCNCHPRGAQHAACDIISGQCDCRAHVRGRACDLCESGFWGLDSSQGCSPCHCDKLGAFNASCDQVTGQCRCRPGIGGPKCDSCLPGYVGFSPDGCRECDPCDKPGYVCDPDTGHCVCPPLTSGDACEVCELNSWGYRTGKGCRPCACEAIGSYQTQCDPSTGQCNCRTGYSGDRCHACAPGYYGFPNCRLCKCDPEGTNSAACDSASGRCQCDPSGQCPCKENVEGLRCDSCREGTFGLRADNPDGCQMCFCFGRSTKCSERGLTWGRVLQQRARTLFVEYDSQTPQFRPGAQLFPVNTREICYINLALPGAGEMSFNASDRLNVTNNLRIIPGDAGDVEMGVSYLFDTPIYWQLPKQFLGDRVLSYGGYLRFNVETYGGSTLFPPEVLDTYPLIQLQGNNRIILEYFPQNASPDGYYEVVLHHSVWRPKNNITSQVSRDIFMLALQNIQHILIRATDAVDFTKAVLHGISMDKAEPAPGRWAPPAHGVEVCECPRQYTASSCQDPNAGFYRWYNHTRIVSTIEIHLVGEARPCQCSGRSDRCHKETGHCLNCSSNTGGFHCERCAEGYYGDPAQGFCKACPCPTPTRNFAYACDVTSTGTGDNVRCFCRDGYEGALCDRCAPGWFGNPHRHGGSCQPCNCHPLGSVNDECDGNGQCECFPEVGVTGMKCDICPTRQVLTSRSNCTTCDDSCSGRLLRDLDRLKLELEQGAGRVSDGVLEAPWAILDNIVAKGREARVQLAAWQRQTDRLTDHIPTVSSVRKPAQRALAEAMNIEKTASEMSSTALDLKHSLERILTELEITNAEVENTVSALNTYSVSQSNTFTMSAALAEAQYKLDSINANMLYMEPRATQTHNNFRRCDELHDELQRILNFSEVDKLAAIKERILQLDLGLAHLNDTLAYSLGNVSHVEQRFSSKNKRKLENLINKSSRLAAQDKAIAGIITNSAQKLNEIDKVIRESEMKLKVVRANQGKLRNLTNSLRQTIMAENGPDLANFYVIARDRALYLNHTARQFEELFSATKNYANLALTASTAYQTIADTLNEALRAAKNASSAIELAYRKAYPRHLDSLPLQANLTLLDSRRLQGPAKEQVARVEKLKNDVVTHQRVVNTLRDTIVFAGHRNNENQKPLQKLEERFATERLSAQAVLRDSKVELSSAREMNIQLKEIRSNSSTYLRPLLNQLRNDDEASFSSADIKIKEVKLELLQANDRLLTITEEAAEKQRDFSRWNDTVGEKVRQLRDKITRARHAAEGIRLSLTSTPGTSTGCSRTYRLPYAEPTTTSSISFYYAATSNARSSPILYIPSSTSDDFIAVEVFDRKFRLVWDLGGGYSHLTHPLKIRNAKDSARENIWYRVEIERTSNVAFLSVVEAIRPDGAAPPKVVSNATASGFGRLDIGFEDVAWIGNPPSGARKGLLAPADQGLEGCIHSLKLDGRPLGLWNFNNSTANCNACKQGVQRVQDDQTYNFRGDGYSELRHSSSSPYNKYFFSLSLNFRTFDENALIFLAFKIDRGRYVSLALQDGRVKFRIGYGGADSHLEISTIARYNTGNWTKVEASRYFDRHRSLEKGVLKVDSESRNGSPPTPLKADAIPDLSGAIYYVGGVPPGFAPIGPFATPISFLGCMSMIQVDQEGYNPLRGQFYGVEGSCSDKALKVVSFSGDGYVELPSHSLKKKASFGFVFATMQPDAMLMVSTFRHPGEKRDRSEVKEENTNFIELEDSLDSTDSYYSCSLWNGRLEIRADAGRGGVALQSLVTLDDGAFHSVSVAKTGRRLELRVDDVLQATETLPEGATVVRAPGRTGGLFLGGIPAGLNITDILAASTPLIGTIKDVIFNDELILVDHPVALHHAGVGRLGPERIGEGVVPGLGMSAMNTSPHPVSIPQPSSPVGVVVQYPGPSGSTSGTPMMGCRKPSSYSTEADAVKFGDATNSHVQITLRRRNLLQKDFSLQLQFRTYYPNGMLFIIPGARAKQRHYLVAYLLDGLLQVMFRGKRKLEVSLPNTYNNGSWHKMTLKKENRWLSLSVDGASPERIKGPKKINMGNVIYVGGISETIPLTPDNFIQRMDPFRGCMRRLSVNEVSQDLVGDNAMHHRVGQCFSIVEQGSHFPGDAYAIYKNRFLMGDLFRLEVEFRTSEMSGILLSISEQKGYPAMSLELNSGKVVLNGDIGDRRKFQIEQGLASQWALCDNQWHKIEVSYERGELVLQVDDIIHVHQLSDDGHHLDARINAPLFIGGVPDRTAAEILSVKDNFKGCMRKVMVGGERRDWTIMADLHSVGLGSCPVTT